MILNRSALLYQILSTKGGMTTRELAEASNYVTDNIYDSLKKLAKRGIITRDNGRWYTTGKPARFYGQGDCFPKQESTGLPALKLSPGLTQEDLNWMTAHRSKAA